MKKLSAYQVLEILFPVAFHYGMMLLAAMLTGNFLDAASQTTLAALLALPFLWMLYKKEPKPEKIFPPFPLASAFCGNGREHLFSLILNAVHLTEHFSNASQEALFQSNLLLRSSESVFCPLCGRTGLRGLVYGKMRRLFSFGWQPRSAQRFCPLSWKHRSAGLCLSHGPSSGLVLRTLGKSFSAGAPSHRSQSSWNSGDGDQEVFDSVMCSMP